MRGTRSLEPSCLLGLVVALLLLLPEGGNAAMGRCRSKRKRAAVVHLLNRAAFGPTDEAIEHVCEVGREAWIEAQLEPGGISDDEIAARLAIYPSLTLSTAELLERYPEPEPGEPRDPSTAPGRVLAELSASLVTRAVHGEAQLEAVLVDFWLNHFNVFAAEGPTRWTILSYVRDAIRPYVLGRFEDLLRATAESAAMLYYLDNYVNVAEGSRGEGSGINENYARELLELHTLGVDGGYSQADVVDAARVLTGWTITPPRLGTIEFVFRPRWHDGGEKSVLGRSVAPGGVEEGRDLVSLLAAEPATASFVAAKLVGRLVGDEPPAAIVERAAETFRRTGGDLKAVVGAILRDEDFDDRRNRDGKVKTPFEFVASALRAVGADVRVGVSAARLIADLGQPLLQARPPTGWPEAAESVVSAGGMLSRFRASYAIAAGRLDGVDIDTAQWDRFMAERRPSDGILEEMLNRKPRGRTRRALRRAERDGADAVLLAALALASPEFQQQ